MTVQGAAKRDFFCIFSAMGVHIKHTSVHIGTLALVCMEADACFLIRVTIYGKAL